VIPAAENAVDILDQEENLAHFDPAELDSGSDVGSDINEPNDATSATYDALISNLLQMVDFLETEREFPGDKCVKKLTETMGALVSNALGYFLHHLRFMCRVCLVVALF